MTARNAGSDFRFTLEIPEQSLFEFPKMENLLLGVQSKKPGFGKCMIMLGYFSVSECLHEILVLTLT